MPSLLVVVAVAVCCSRIGLHFFPQVITEKVDLIVHGKMSFLFITEYVKIRLQLQIYANVILLMIFIVDHPV